MSREAGVDSLMHVVDLFLHLDRHLVQFVAENGQWTYALLVAVIFCETGLVVAPFLPGDSLLFAAGAVAGLGAVAPGALAPPLAVAALMGTAPPEAAAGGVLSPHLLFFGLALAAIVGDTVNYQLGHLLGERIFSPDARVLKTEYLERTHRFYEKHGGKTIILARFVPIIRTFAPFVAGVGAMTYSRFLAYNVIGGVAWVGAFVYGGYFFGQAEIVKKNFSLVVIAIIIISVLPIAIEFVKARNAAKAA